MRNLISRKKALNEWKLYLFVMPSFLVVTIFAYFPSASTIYHSFFQWGGGETKRFIGLQNFQNAFSDAIFWNSFVTIGILVFANVFKMIPAIGLAVLLHRIRSDRWQYWYRVLLVIPMIIPGLVTLFIWKFFFEPTRGVLNSVINVTGLKSALVWIDGIFDWGVFFQDVPIGWLSQPDLIVPSLIIWGFPWIGAVGVLIYLAGLQSIGSDVYEAADLDGVTGWQKFVHIEFPLIMTQIRLNLLLMVMGTLQSFGLQFVLLGDAGGPAGRGMVPGLWMFNRAFVAGEFGYACALGLFLFVFILVLSWINNKYVRIDK